MPAGDIQLWYPAAFDLTFTVASLLSDAGVLIGRQSNAVSNLTTRAMDYILSGRVTTGTGLTAGRIEIWAIASWDGTNWPTGIGSTDANRTLTNGDIRNSIARLVASMNTTTTANQAYDFGGVPVSSLFNGLCPPAFVLWCVHNTGAALHTTGHQFKVQPVYGSVIQW